MKKISIIFGGPSSEHNVSIETARSVFENIDKHKYNTWLFYISKDNNAYLYKSKTFSLPYELKSFTSQIKKLKEFDMNFIAGHGEFMEDGRLQSIMDFFEIKYTGSDSFASSLCMDKRQTNAVVEKHNIVHIPRIYSLDDNPKLPVIAKPNRLGSSVGIKIIKTMSDLIKIRQNEDYIIQEYIQGGIELSCAVLEINHIIQLLPPVEIKPKSTFFDYNSKYTDGGSVEICPPVGVDKKVSNNISLLAAKIHKLLGCSVYSRSDFIYANKKIYYLETNTLPGLTKNSLLPKEVTALNMSFTQLINTIIDESINKYLQ